MKKSIQNSEYRIQKARNAQSRDDAVGGTRAFAVPAGRTGYGADFRCRFATLPGQGRKVGKGGKTAAKKVGFSRLFAPFPGISHLFPLGFFLPGGAGSQKSEGEAGRNYVGKSADNYGKFHESSRKFAQIRPVNPRCYALLRVRPIFGHG